MLWKTTINTTQCEIYGWVDRSNQQLAYYNSEFRSVRKQSRVFDNLCEMYVYVNGHTLWRNMEGNASLSQSEFRFSIIRHWYAMYRKTNGSKESLHYPSYKPSTHRRKLSATLMSPRQDRHARQSTQGPLGRYPHYLNRPEGCFKPTII